MDLHVFFYVVVGPYECTDSYYIGHVALDGFGDFHVTDLDGTPVVCCCDG